MMNKLIIDFKIKKISKLICGIKKVIEMGWIRRLNRAI